jgi:RNA 3'-terminal phosphate cyclase-like protein
MTSSQTKKKSLVLRFEDGAVQFRQRIAVSLLTNRPLLLFNVRSESIQSPGLRPHEASFLRLIDQITNGTRIEINNTGTQLRFVPGVLTGGEFRHVCAVGGGDDKEEGDDDDDAEQVSYRSIGWFLEGIIPIAPFGKEALSILFSGITDGMSYLDPSPDYLRASVLPILAHFGIGQVDKDDIMSPQAPSIRIVKRGAAPAGGGEVHIYCPIVPKELKTIDLVDPGKIKRVRGSSISCKVVSSSMAARVAFSAKGLLHRLLPDVWIHTDCVSQKNNGCGPSPGLSLVLTAQSTTGVVLAAETCLDHRSVGNRELPEDLGTRGAAMLLEEVRRGGCIDTGMQSLVLLWMCLTPEDVSRLRIGTMSQYTIESLRLFKEGFGVEFKVKADQGTKTVLLSCLGSGYRNMSRAST